MMRLFVRIQYRFSKWLSHVKSRVVWIVFGLIALVIALVPLMGESIGRFFVDMLSPVSLWKIPYYGMCKENNGFASSIAYAIGVLVLSGFFIPFVTNYLRTLGEKYTAGTLSRYHWKNHIVFLGYDDLMIGTLRSLCRPDEKDGKESKKARQVVVAVPDGVAALRDKLRGKFGEKIEVIQANQCNRRDLCKRVCVETAYQVFIVGQPNDQTHDATNLASLGVVAALCKDITTSKSKMDSVPCMYYIRNQATFYLLHRHKVEPKEFQNAVNDAGRDLFDEKKIESFFLASEPFNVFESIARHLMVGSIDGLDGIRFSNDPQLTPHLVVVGMTPMGTALARMAMMIAHFPEKTLRVTMVDEHAFNEMRYFIGRHRSFFENCKYSYTCFDDHSHDIQMPEKAKLDYLDVEVEFIQCNVSHPELTEYLKQCTDLQNKESLAIAVCTEDSPKNMAFALYLPRQILESRIPVWVFQNGDDSMNSFMRHKLYDSVHIFSPAEYGVANRALSNEWLLAKAVAMGYDSRYMKTIISWNRMQPINKWSSLYGAISKIVMLRALGKTTFPVQLSEVEKRQIASTEHNRWNTEKLLNGFIPTSQEQHDILKHVPYGESLKDDFVHDNIRPFDELGDATKKKDYEQTDDVVNELNKINAKSVETKGNPIVL